MRKITAFQAVGQGRVDSNKEIFGEDGGIQYVIEIIPTEWIGMRDGEMTSNATVTEYSTQDQDGIDVKGSVVGAGTIKARWLPGGSNRVTPPDVRRGMRVEILQSADKDEYYWRYHGLDDNLMKLETIIFGISNSTDEGDTELNLGNMHWFEFSTHSQKIAVSTSKNNGEPYLYEMFIDAKVGEMSMNDDIGHLIRMVSKESLIHAENDKGAFLKLDKLDVKINAPQDGLFNLKRDFKLNAGRDVLITAGRSFKVKAATDVEIDGGGSKYTSDAGNTSIISPTIDLLQG